MKSIRSKSPVPYISKDRIDRTKIANSRSLRSDKPRRSDYYSNNYKLSPEPSIFKKSFLPEISHSPINRKENSICEHEISHYEEVISKSYAVRTKLVNNQITLIDKRVKNFFRSPKLYNNPRIVSSFKKALKLPKLQLI